MKKIKRVNGMVCVVCCEPLVLRWDGEGKCVEARCKNCGDKLKDRGLGDGVK